MIFKLATALTFGVFAVIFVLLALWIGKFLRPKGRPFAEKDYPYECAERPLMPAWFNYNPRFYIYAIAFIIFDIEVAFIFPVAVVYRKWLEAHLGGLAFLEIAIFSIILFIGLVYLWGKHDLEWIRVMGLWSSKKPEVKTHEQS